MTKQLKELVEQMEKDIHWNVSWQMDTLKKELDYKLNNHRQLLEKIEEAISSLSTDVSNLPTVTDVEDTKSECFACDYSCSCSR